MVSCLGVVDGQLGLRNQRIAVEMLVVAPSIATLETYVTLVLFFIVLAIVDQHGAARTNCKVFAQASDATPNCTTLRTYLFFLKWLVNAP